LSIGTGWRSVWRRYLFVIFFLAASSELVSGCAKQEAARPPRPSVPVIVSYVTQKSVPVEVSAIGNVEAYSTVSIKAQISGELLEVHFKEGDSVRRGQLLLTIDPRPYQAALAQAQAALARDRALAANNHAQAQRYAKLLEAGIVPPQEAESFTSAADAADAGVKADEAAVQTAQINLEFCRIYSPIDGRTGYLMLKPGNLVKVADVPIVVINQVSPIFVNFTVPQQVLPDIRKFMAEGTLSVTATLPNDSGPDEHGTLTFVDNAVDPTTGTIHLRATFANPQNRLWPGLYVNILLTLSKEANAIVVPAHAIVPGQRGPFVYVVRSDSTVEARPVVSARAVEGESVIEKGLKVGETVVTEGQGSLAPGTKVEIKNPSSDNGPAGQPAEPLTRPKAP
jgi:multidrug efflux system membrane fusion protein